MKKHVIRIALSLSLGLFLCISCEKEETKETLVPPTISFESEEGEYRVKTGGSITLNAMVENAVNPIYSWKIGGKIVGNEPHFTFIGEKVGEYFVNFRVDAANGSDEKQVKISVLDKLPPQITLGTTAVAHSGIDKEFVAEVMYAENAAYVWRLDGEIVSESASYTFNRTEQGNYLLTLKVTTAEGQDMRTITITVLPEPQPELFFDDGRYRTVNNVAELRKMTVPEGRKLVLAPVVCNISDTVGFEWKVDGAIQAATGEYFTFTPPVQGVYMISVTETGSGASATVQVTCTPPEGTYRRTGGVKNHATQALDFGPAPGQFIDYQSGSTKAKALEAMQTWCNNGRVAGSWFMIGAYGGYFVAGFDHSVANMPNQPDLEIPGNSFSSQWCESGIVWVMQDNNNNGLPDDTWYELKGSETGKPDTRQRLAMTYYKPKAANANVLWTDNIGRSGSVDWNGFHTQQYYYPMFITEDYYTLTGTCLASTFSMAGTLETSSCYNWGYVDGQNSSTERPNSAQFWLEDAIHADGSPVELQYIDFVKVHTAVTGKGTAVGELSTEAELPTDLNF
jgi:hypothetical protein